MKRTESARDGRGEKAVPEERAAGDLLGRRRTVLQYLVAGRPETEAWVAAGRVAAGC